MNKLDVLAQSWREPAECFAAFANRAHCVWLDSASGGRYSILAAEPTEIFRAKGRQIELIASGGAVRFQANPFDALNEQLARYRRDVDAPFPAAGAAIGYFGYDLKNTLERLPANAADDLGLPDCWFGFYENLLVFDHAARVVFEVGRDRQARRFPDEANGRRDCPSLPGLDCNFTRETYRRTVLRAKEYIAAGDIYQVNLAQRFQCDIAQTPTELYSALRHTNPAPYSAYLDIGEAQILSSSPECFLDIRDQHVITRPIKGTRPRSTDPAELLASPKDNAELLMITDLERNDLGRVCQFGSVYVSELRRIETFATVHHLVATVEGLLRRDTSHIDCVRACFPGGSVTGAPKIRAMQIVDELEPHARGVYTGAIGFLGFNGTTKLNVAIRTIMHHSGRLTFHAGSGIVADSEPDDEYDETLAKAQGMFDAIDQLRVR